MNESRLLPEDEEIAPMNPRVEPPATETGEEGEFRLVVRKLELPVRPRGVLAE
jgi:hypothetical protein